MNNKLLLLSVLISSTLFSQKYVDTLYNFKIEEENIVWQKIYTTKEIKDFKTQLKQNEFTAPLTENSNTFTGRTNNTKKRVVKNTPYYATFGFDAFCTINFKKNRYRVTLKDIVFDGPTITALGVEQKQNYPLQLNVLKRNKIKISKKNIRVLKNLDSIINSKFIFKEEKKEDW